MKKTPFAECKGQLYIKAKYAGMHHLCLFIDGLTITLLGKSKKPYLRIDEAIRWHENEIEQTDGKWDRKFLDVLLEAKRKFVPVDCQHCWGTGEVTYPDSGCGRGIGGQSMTSGPCGECGGTGKTPGQVEL